MTTLPIPMQLIRRFYFQLIALRLHALVLVLLVYMTSSWLLLEVAGEQDLTRDAIDFIYFMATTGSTVGYGDISPASPGGKLVATFWLYPGGILVFSLAVGKVGSAVVERMQKMAKGLADYSGLAGATVLIGYDPERTPMMIRDIVAGNDGDRDIILLSCHQDVALPDNVRFVYAKRLDSDEALQRAAIQTAEKILIYGESDAESLNAALAVREHNQQGHVVAFFHDRATARRAETLANVSTIVSISTEMLVRAAQDPGAEKVVMALSAATEASTIYSNVMPTGTSIPADRLHHLLYQQGAIITAKQGAGETAPAFGPFTAPFAAGDIVYYIASQRFTETAFSTLLQEIT